MQLTTFPNRTKGVSMVEVLVALIVMSVGMLGIASLYVTALQAKTTSLSRMQAVNLASDMADRIRANRSATSGYDTGATTPADNGCTDSDTVTTAVADNCTDAELAEHDLFLWNDRITNTLPGSPTGTVTVNTGTTPDTYTITLNWTEPNGGALSYALQVQI